MGVVGPRKWHKTVDTSEGRCEIPPASMWSAYSARQSADLVGLTESAVRGLIREGVLGERADLVPTRLAFSDLALLRTVKGWRDDGISIRKIRRQLSSLRRRIGDAPLTSLRISAHGAHLIVTDELGSYRADNGQLFLPFAGSPSPSAAEAEDVENFSENVVVSLPDRGTREAAAREAAESEAFEQNISEWFERALELEDLDAGEAIVAYGKVLELRPESVETLINLGRLHAEAGSIDEATGCFERALAINPSDATANYNLGVVAQDAGDDAKARTLYTTALKKDPALAEAHYNLATIYDRTGDPRAAIRHINEYRKLIR